MSLWQILPAGQGRREPGFRAYSRGAPSVQDMSIELVAEVTQEPKDGSKEHAELGPAAPADLSGLEALMLGGLDEQLADWS